MLLEIRINDDPVVATGEPADGVDVAAFAEEADRAVAEAEEGAAVVAARKGLRRRTVDHGAGFIHPPHHVADPDGAVAQPGYAGPERGTLADRRIENALANGRRVRGAVGDLRNLD